MASFYDRAKALVDLGFRVFPLVGKQPLPIKGDMDHFDAASMEEKQLQAWDKQVPDANVGLMPDEIFCFLETDSEPELLEAAKEHGVPPEAWDTARFTSGRPNRACYVFRQTTRTWKVGNLTLTREGKDNLFELKQFRMYVTGPGSIHPLTGKPYYWDTWIKPQAMPEPLLDLLCELHGKPRDKQKAEIDAKTQEQLDKLDKFLETYEVATVGDWFSKGKTWYRPIICPWQSEHENPNLGTSTCVVYTEGGGYGFDCKHRCANKTWHDFREELKRRTGKDFSFVETIDAEVTIGEQAAPEAVSDWRSIFHTREESEHTPEIRFVIEGFLQEDGITGLSAPPGHRKTLIMLNITRSLLTGEPLFKKFKVNTRAERVIYLVPEVALTPFVHRLRQFELLSYIGREFFFRTLSASGKIGLASPVLREALRGAHVFLDTVPRFIEGDENDAEDIRRLGEQLFNLLQCGAKSVIGAFHMPKGAKKLDYFDLETCVRGSSDLGALLTACWGTRLQDEKEPYKCASYVECVKGRDFEACPPFEVMSSPAGIMTTREGVNVVKLNAGLGNHHASNKDGQAQRAIDYISEHMDQSLREMEAGLKAMGIERKKDWISQKRKALLSTADSGVVV